MKLIFPKRFIIMIACLTVFYSVTAAVSAADTEKVMIREAPGGKPIAVIKTSTPFQIEEDSGEWVKVTVTGWISRAELMASGRETRTYPEQKVMSPHGEFVISGLAFKRGEAGTKCSGLIQNNTDKSAKVVTFLFQVYAEDGRQLESSFFTVDKLKKREKKPFTVDLRYTTPGEIYAFTVTYETSF